MLGLRWSGWRKVKDEPPAMEVEIKRGERGFYRVFVYDEEGELAFLSQPVRGYPTWTDARKVAGGLMRARFEFRSKGEESNA